MEEAQAMKTQATIVAPAIAVITIGVLTLMSSRRVVTFEDSREGCGCGKISYLGEYGLDREPGTSPDSTDEKEAGANPLGYGEEFHVAG